MGCAAACARRGQPTGRALKRKETQWSLRRGVGHRPWVCSGGGSSRETVAVSGNARPGPLFAATAALLRLVVLACVCTSDAGGSAVDASVAREPFLEMYVVSASFSGDGEGLLDVSWEGEDLDVWDDDDIPAQAGGTLEAPAGPSARSTPAVPRYVLVLVDNVVVHALPLGMGKTGEEEELGERPAPGAGAECPWRRRRPAASPGVGV